MLVLELVRSRARELGGCNDASFSRSAGPDPRVSPPKLRLSFSTPAFPGPGAALPLACHRSASRSRGPLWTSRSPSTLSGVDRKRLVVKGKNTGSVHSRDPSVRERNSEELLLIHQPPSYSWCRSPSFQCLQSFDRSCDCETDCETVQGIRAPESVWGMGERK